MSAGRVYPYLTVLLALTVLFRRQRYYLVANCVLAANGAITLSLAALLALMVLLALYSSAIVANGSING